MKTRSLLALPALLAVTAIASAFAPAPVYREPPRPKPVDLVTQLQGTWEMSNGGAVGFGRRGGMAMRRSTFIRIQDNTWGYIHSFNGAQTEGVKYDMGLDPTQKPATLDLKNFQNGGAFGIDNVAMKGIVKVEGDTMTFCYVYGHQNMARPADFDAGNAAARLKGFSCYTMVFKKVK